MSVLTNDLELTRLYDINALMLLSWQAYCHVQYLVPFDILARSGTRIRR